MPVERRCDTLDGTIDLTSTTPGPYSPILTMRMIVAIIQPTKLKAVQAALTDIGVERMTVCDAQGYALSLIHI